MFEYNICIPASVDIDELIDKWNNDPKIVNYFHRQFTLEEYTIINFIVNEGLKDIRGQEPADDPFIEDDPYARPGIDNPNLDPENPDDDDPYARPEGWNPEAGIFYDKETGKLVNADGKEVDKFGNIIEKDSDEDYTFEDEQRELPNWENWIEFWKTTYPDVKVIPGIPVDVDNPYYQEFHDWLKNKNPEGGSSEKPEGPPEEWEENNNPYLKDWLEFWAENYPDQPAEPFPQTIASPYYEDFMEFLSNKYSEGNEGIATSPLGTVQEF